MVLRSAWPYEFHLGASSPTSMDSEPISANRPTRRHEERMTMKAMLHAATMVVSIGTSSAYADEDDGYSATTLFTLIPGERPSLAATAPGGADCGRGRRSGAQLCAH